MLNAINFYNINVHLSFFPAHFISNCNRNQRGFGLQPETFQFYMILYLSNLLQTGCSKVGSPNSLRFPSASARSCNMIPFGTSQPEDVTFSSMPNNSLRGDCFLVASARFSVSQHVANM